MSRNTALAEIHLEYPEIDYFHTPPVRVILMAHLFVMGDVPPMIF